MRVLVTGATGFVGSHLTEELCKQGYNVTVLVRTKWHESPPSWLNQTNVIYGNVTDPVSVEKAIKGVDVVFNLASLLGRWQSEYTETEYAKVNVFGPKLLVSVSKKENIRQFIHMSTAGVMGRLVNVPADENHPLGPQFPYEKSKCLAELLLKDQKEKGHFPVTIIRATHIYGPRDTNTVKIFRLIKKTRTFPLIGGGKNLFQPIYIRDLVKALILCMDKPSKSIGQTYLLAGKNIVTYRDFLLLSAQLLGTHLTTIPVSERLAKTLASFVENVGTALNFEPPLTQSRVEFFSRDQVYNINKIYNDLGFIPETTLKDGLSEMIHSYFDN